MEAARKLADAHASTQKTKQNVYGVLPVEEAMKSVVEPVKKLLPPKVSKNIAPDMLIQEILLLGLAMKKKPLKVKETTDMLTGRLAHQEDAPHLFPTHLKKMDEKTFEVRLNEEHPLVKKIREMKVV